MTFSAKAMFTDWYNAGLKKEASIEELNKRRLSVDKTVDQNDPAFWISAAKIYLGKLTEDSDGYQGFIRNFKEDDEHFPLKNANLAKLLAGCVIAEKIEQSNNYLSDLLSLAIIINQSEEHQVLTELFPLANEFWIARCELNRSLILSDLPETATTLMAKKTIPAIADHSGIPTFSTQLKEYLSPLSKDLANSLVKINEIINWNEEMQANFKALSEETNILWWVFGGFSNVLKRGLNTLSEPLLSVIIACELDALTTTLPGAGKIEAIINKVLNVTNSSNSHVHTIYDFILSTKEDIIEIKKHVPDLDPILVSICPLTYGLNSYSEYSGLEWKEFFSKKTGVNHALSLNLTRFTSQLYQELMLVRIYNLLSKK